MKLAAISIVRDEADIIEAWARHNLSLLDRIFVCDNGSCDATLEILKALQSEGLPIEIVSGGVSSNFQQGKMTTELLNYVKTTEVWDFIFPLDADECLDVVDREALEAALSSLPKGTVPGLGAVHYCPCASDDVSDPNPLTRIRHAAPYAKQIFKIAVPKAIAQKANIFIHDGNHHASLGDIRVPEHLLNSVRLAHFPIRSREQALAKFLSGYVRWASRFDYNKTMADKLKRSVIALGETKSVQIDNFDALADAWFQLDGQEPLECVFCAHQPDLSYQHLAHSYPYRGFLDALELLIKDARIAATLQHDDEQAVKRAQKGWAQRMLERHARSITKRVHRKHH